MKVDDSTPAETERQPNFNHLWLFYNVARFGSVSAAARALRTSQPSISRQVRTLAENLGTDLFVRKGRTILLTDAGRLLFDHAQRIFTLGADAVRPSRSGAAGGRRACDRRRSASPRLLAPPPAWGSSFAPCRTSTSDAGRTRISKNGSSLAGATSP